MATSSVDRATGLKALKRVPTMKHFSPSEILRADAFPLLIEKNGERDRQ